MHVASSPACDHHHHSLTDAVCPKRLIIRLLSLADPTSNSVDTFLHHLLEVTNFHLKLRHVFSGDVAFEEWPRARRMAKRIMVVKHIIDDRVDVEKVSRRA